LFALSTLYLPISIYRGAGLAKAVTWKLGRLGGIIRLGSPDSPGGGGPGQSPTSTNPPPSVEEVGRMITQQRRYDYIDRYGDISGGKKFVFSADRDWDPKGCPQGWHWSSKLNKCVRNRR